jgi:hypothetical protein
MSNLLLDIQGNVPEEKWLPKYSDKGRILFAVYPVPNEPPQYEVFDYDSDSSVCWIHEGIGCDYFLANYVDLDIELEGMYVMEGVHGYYYRGNWSYGEDDDEEWEFEFIRRASPEEEESQTLEE